VILANDPLPELPGHVLQFLPLLRLNFTQGNAGFVGHQSGYIRGLNVGFGL
jgi:hypothetical protein